MRKLNVGVIFGGRSAEHEISLLSAKNVINGLKKKFSVIPIGIDKFGRFLIFDLESDFILNSNNPKKIALGKNGERAAFIPGKEKSVWAIDNGQKKIKLDVIFPVLHGTFGEDGTIQGLLKMADIPFVGAGVLSSAICMDKEVTKKLLRDAGIKIADFVSLHREEINNIEFKLLTRRLGLPFFIKPANAGSSVGVHKVKTKKDFLDAVKDAFRYDTKILVERMIVGKEIECAVLGNEKPVASLPCRVIPKHEFYSYAAKYLDNEGALFEIPAKLPLQVVMRIKKDVINAYRVLGCEGMARVDGFLTNKDEFIVNEINTIPGFTAISMYPKMWAVSGLGYTELLNRLINLAISRYNRDRKIKTHT